MATVFRSKVEERAKAKVEDAASVAEPASKRACTQFEKQMQKMGDGDKSLVKARENTN